jgi:hypothetical protein
MGIELSTTLVSSSTDEILYVGSSALAVKAKKSEFERGIFHKIGRIIYRDAIKKRTV